ncbi:MAG: hypothetical protein KGK34_12450, partial [Chloroflexota bacterium]|nr:hypothetical protein [Chloroflexota bacterium]
ARPERPAARSRLAAAASRPPEAGGRRQSRARALEHRITELEERIKTLEQQLADVARAGNYMETRRVGEEHASLEKALRRLYDEWAEQSS